MTNHEVARCPACDSANPAHAAFCANCGKPMGSGAAAAPSEMDAGSVGAAENTGTMGYVVAAVAVAAVLIVGGALFLLGDADDSDETAVTAPPASEPDPTSPTTPVTVPAVSVPAVTAPLTEVPTTPVPAATTVPPPTAAPTTVAPPPTPTVAPQTLPRATAPPAPAPAPEPTPPPPPGATLSFAEAESFFRNYIATAEDGDYNGAWSLLSSSDRADYPNGFDQFVGFWRSVSFAEVQRVESVGGSAGFQSLAVDMAYGQVDGDPTSFEVVEVDVNVRPDGSLQIFDYRYIRNQ